MTQQAYQSSMQNGLLFHKLLRFEELPNHGKFLRIRERELLERCKQMFTHIAGFLSMANISVIADAQLLQDLLDRDAQAKALNDPQCLDAEAANMRIADLEQQVKKLKEEARANGQCELAVRDMQGHWSENFAQLARGIDKLQKTLNNKEKSDGS